MTIAFQDIHEAIDARFGDVDGQTAVLAYGDPQIEEAKARTRVKISLVSNLGMPRHPVRQRVKCSRSP